MHISDAKLQEVRERADLVALVQRHGVELKKAGRAYRGLCPFHGEKSPSFHVWPDGHFFCFGCQASGDAIGFVQRLLGKPFLETVRDLAAELGIELDQVADPAFVERQQVKDATDFAQQHFVERLWDPIIGRAARDYLHGRGLTDDIIRAFGLGWAPLAWTELADKLRERGLLSFGERAGLVSPRQKGEGYYDMFRGRVMIPIRAPEGRVIAFGGRLLLGEDGPKYLNSKENRLYNKSDTLYGTDVARDEIRKRKSAVLCEGYFDAIGMHHAGVKNAVALCSTALTPGHLALLHRLDAKELVLLLDGDEAGRKAVERLAGVILAAGVPARVAALPDGHDPDTWAREVGEEIVHTTLRQAPSLTNYLFTTLLPKGALSDFEEKMAALDRMRPIAAQLQVGLARAAFVGSLAKWFGLPGSTLELELKGRAAAPVKPQPKIVRRSPREVLEFKWVSLILRRPELLKADNLRAVDEISHAGLRRLVGGLQFGRPVADAVFDAPEDMKLEFDRWRPDVNRLTDEQAEQAFATKSLELKRAALDERLEQIRVALENVPGGNVDLTPESTALLAERSALTAAKEKLKSQK